MQGPKRSPARPGKERSRDKSGRTTRASPLPQVRASSFIEIVIFIVFMSRERPGLILHVFVVSIVFAGADNAGGKHMRVPALRPGFPAYQSLQGLAKKVPGAGNCWGLKAS
jgi:hypothetical protein